MGLFERFKAGLLKTHDKLVHEMRRVVSGSPKLTVASAEELEAALLAADFGMATTQQLLAVVRQAYESQGRSGVDILAVARRELERVLACAPAALNRVPGGVTVVSMVGVNGTGKTTTTATLAHRLKQEGEPVLLAACDTFRAAAIEQLKEWGRRLELDVIAGAYGADPAAVAHDALSSALARKASYLLVDTAGRLHTKHNLMHELQKVHRVLGKVLPGAPQEVLLVLDATTGMNALAQAREFHKAVALTGLVVTKLDGTSRGGVAVAIQQELGLPVKFVGLGEQLEDLQPFKPGEYAAALFAE
jgi:fused signal recognition particle receptor